MLGIDGSNSAAADPGLWHPWWWFYRRHDRISDGRVDALTMTQGWAWRAHGCDRRAYPMDSFVCLIYGGGKTNRRLHRSWINRDLLLETIAKPASSINKK
jgi:hypothetical protein